MLSPPRNSEQVLNIPPFINQAHLEATHPIYGALLRGGRSRPAGGEAELSLTHKDKHMMTELLTGTGD